MLRRNLCLAFAIAITAGASAQTSEKPKLSDDYAKAALKAVICIWNEHGVESAINDAEAASVSAVDEASLGRLKFFSVMHRLNAELFDATVELKPAQTDEDLKRIERETGVERDRECVAAWKTALRAKESDTPKACDTPAKGKS